ncbi:hypothetical protein KY345_01100 [Candidatus Woesearchaeota archaeon]|nr:hypothetical protein [Candidatus Woesearchaeota archaeon]
MLKSLKRYHGFFDPHKAEGLFKKILSGFMLTFPHILTCLVLIGFYPQEWIGILIIGLLLPDLSYFFHMFVHPAAMFRGKYEDRNIGDKRKKAAHILTFIIIIVLLLNKECVLFFAGGIHLFLDLLGF